MASSFPIARAQEPEYDKITDVWEASVRATHFFLSEEDIVFYRQLIRNDTLRQLDVYYIRNENGRITAFSGIAGGKIEMLFVSPEERGKGLGKHLVVHAVRFERACLVDVNEQNEQSFAFYRKMGFVPFARDETDMQGKPFPVIHMKLRTPDFLHI